MFDQSMNARKEQSSPWVGVMRTFFSQSHHLFATLKMEPTRVDQGGVCVEAVIPDFFAYQADDRQAHTGAYTIILDTVFGFAVFAKLQNLKAIATINLKTEYLGAVEIGAKIVCSAECHSLDGDIARLRGEIVGEAGIPLASATGAFMISSSGPDFTALFEKESPA